MSRPQLPESAYAELGLPPSVLEALMNPKPPPVEQRSVPPPDIVAPNLLQSDEDGTRPMQPNETSIVLYAELLLHIRTVTLFASLRTNHSRETKARASADGRCITVSHEGESATIRLPFNVKGAGDAALSLPSQPPTKELTLRMQLEETDDTDVLGALNSEDRQANVVPWDGASLNEVGDAVVCCKNCGEVMVGKGRVSEWRDLPNENWAEMMDFWHCHKPDESHAHGKEEEEAVGNKGYAAANRLQALGGVGFVDLTSFLFKEDDCEGAQLSPEGPTQSQAITCRHCDHILGHPDLAAGGWRLQKWNLGMRSSTFFAAGLPTSYSPQKWISARFLHLIENSGVRKFHVHPIPCSTPPRPTPSDHDHNDHNHDRTDNSNEGPQTTAGPPPTPSLQIWLFTPDLLFSSSIPSPTRHDPTRAMKIFYKPSTFSPLKPGDPEPAGIEDVELPADLYDELESGLRLSGRVLPRTARRWGGWDVGVLERFDGGEVFGGSKVEKGEEGFGGLESEDVD
ncbi:hypothetical protein T440DRAFT_470913 [Plenodomus tracheiphilus IPT5]|uniref:Ubiquitin-conjugating enzyme E2-binding protein n=1 Tax=Plenodomus tracheiphilus IPT5 TaxID=1408161 RepID=A0A6A7AWZ0_9PLEO|nr:hypothetical protein T440DRAFT_470913 [Plenodomus tracheiphilus IPT5]